MTIDEFPTYEPAHWPDIARAVDDSAPEPDRPFEPRADAFARLLRWLLFGTERITARHHAAGWLKQAMSRPAVQGRRLMVLAYCLGPELLDGATLEQIARASGVSVSQLSLHIRDFVKLFPQYEPYHLAGGKRKARQSPEARARRRAKIEQTNAIIH